MVKKLLGRMGILDVRKTTAQHMQKCLRYFRAEDDPRVYAVNSQVSGDIVIYTAVGYGTISARPAITFTATEQPFGQHQIILLGD